MPPKETYLQIKERNNREIRRRTSDRITALMIENMREDARIRRNKHSASDYDNADPHDVSDEDECNPTIRNRRCTMLPDELNEEFANPRSPRHEKCAFFTQNTETLFEKQGGKGYIFLTSAWLNREL